jgi:hypothetical protein
LAQLLCRVEGSEVHALLWHAEEVTDPTPIAIAAEVHEVFSEFLAEVGNLTSLASPTRATASAVASAMRGVLMFGSKRAG